MPLSGENLNGNLSKSQEQMDDPNRNVYGGVDGECREQDTDFDMGSDTKQGDDSINCLCMQRKDQGLMIQCEKCDLWQHARCMGISSKKDIPDPYYCIGCCPGILDSQFSPYVRSHSSRKRPLVSGNTISKGKAINMRKRGVNLLDSNEGRKSGTKEKRRRHNITEEAVLETNITDFPFPSPPMSREERKIQQLMKSFERMEKKDGKGTKRGNSIMESSGSPHRYIPLRPVSTSKNYAHSKVFCFVSM